LVGTTWLRRGDLGLCLIILGSLSINVLLLLNPPVPPSPLAPFGESSDIDRGSSTLHERSQISAPPLRGSLLQRGEIEQRLVEVERRIRELTPLHLLFEEFTGGSSGAETQRLREYLNQAFGIESESGVYTLECRESICCLIVTSAEQLGDDWEKAIQRMPDRQSFLGRIHFRRDKVYIEIVGE